MWNKWVGIELRRPIKQAQCTQTHSGTHIHAYLTNQRACVSGVSGGVVQKARQAKVGDLADQVAVDQDISGGEVSVNIVHVWQILHACSDAAQHPDQLCHCEAPVVQLQARKKKHTCTQSEIEGEKREGAAEEAVNEQGVENEKEKRCVETDDRGEYGR